MATNHTSEVQMQHGLWLVYSPVNQAWFLMWHHEVLHIGSRADMEWEMNNLLRDVKEG